MVTYKASCGAVQAVDQWQGELSCVMVGCKDCKHFDGTEYVEHDERRLVSIWAKHAKEFLEEGGK